MTPLQKHMEMINDRNFDLDFRNLYHYHNDVWITRDYGVYVPLKDMSIGHIKNCLAFIMEHGPLSCYGLGGLWSTKLKKELKRRKNNVR